MFKMVNEGDLVIVYIKLYNMDFMDWSIWLLYILYFGDLIYLKFFFFDFFKLLSIVDWIDYGFKVFIKVGLCNKGICFFGFKFM